jgi:prephenate dehydratase
MERHQGPLSAEAMARLFREIMSACLALESRLRVAFLGPEGTFTQEAALKHFGRFVETAPLAAIDEVFREVESGSAQFGLVPVENSTEGVINHTLDMFITSPLKICGEVELRIHHHLLGKGNDIKAARRVVSHQQSLAQCREWLDANLPGVERTAVASNAEAARMAAADVGTMAIAGDSAAHLPGLKMFASISRTARTIPRFLVSARRDRAERQDQPAVVQPQPARRTGGCSHRSPEHQQTVSNRVRRVRACGVCVLHRHRRSCEGPQAGQGAGRAGEGGGIPEAARFLSQGGTVTSMAADILRLAIPGVQGLSPYQPGKPIEELEREYGITNAIKLASNENPLGPSPRALEAAREALRDILRYPDGNGYALKQSLARKLSVAPGNITLGNGSNDILELLARAFVQPENEVVFSEHAFAVYPIVTRAVGAQPVITKAKNWVMTSRPCAPR